MTLGRLALGLVVAMGLVQAGDGAPAYSPTSESDAAYDLDDRVLRATPIAAVATRVDETGIASVYGDSLQGRATASGEPYDRDALTAAHRTFPLGSRARVTNLKNNKSVIVRINDRGPHAAGRILDLSRSAAERLGVRTGVVRVRIEVISLPPS
jgi:rare lipoprotein A